MLRGWKLRLAGDLEYRDILGIETATKWYQLSILLCVLFSVLETHFHVTLSCSNVMIPLILSFSWFWHWVNTLKFSIVPMWRKRERHMQRGREVWVQDSMRWSLTILRSRRISICRPYVTQMAARFLSHQTIHTYALRWRRCKAADVMSVSWAGSYVNDKKLLKVSRHKLEGCTLYNKGNDNPDDLQPL